MEMENQNSTVTHFVFLGFSNEPLIQTFLFITFLLIYLITLMGNIIIMMIIRGKSSLHGPMYFFLSHLSFIDICFSSVTVPKLLANVCGNWRISYNGCITQLFFIFLLGTVEVFVLAAMAYDRYAAICKPLHYVQIMNQAFCRKLVGGAWVIAFTHASANTIPAMKLVFCGPNIIKHFSCELPSLLALSCSETFLNSVTFFISAVILISFSLFLILWSYFNIVSSVLKIHSAEARRKTFSTCSSHLIVVILYFSTGCLRNMRTNSASSIVMEEYFSIQYTISTPMLNPIIYSLKTKEVMEAIKKLIRSKIVTIHFWEDICKNENPKINEDYIEGRLNLVIGVHAVSLLGFPSLACPPVCL
ncbi:olfactory receptor 19-like [Sceloporus undulatus]|uniref:olfactory receptor 19-like n=1 Tax=Sceloporus undulatus TaxID=8520 RepID=UPI001C4C75CD|nr:olfactory receptor 19-like [Sceloporus undulatus]